MEKYCIDCKYFNADHIKEDDSTAICMIPSEKIRYDIVWGKIITSTVRFCNIERRSNWGPHEDYCGMVGRRWESKLKRPLPGRWEAKDGT